MQTQNNDIVTCKFCQESLPVTIMFSHRIECNLGNHPEYQSIIQTQNANSNDSKKLTETNDSQIKQNQEIQDLESQKPNSQYLMQHSYKESASQQQIKQINQTNQQTQSILQQTTKKCECCNEIFQKDQIDEHYPKCQVYLMIEKLQIEETMNDYNYQENYFDINGQLKETEFCTQIQEVIQEDGKILQKVITKDPAKNELYETTFIIDSKTNSQQGQISQEKLNPKINQTSFEQSFQSFINNDKLTLLQSKVNDEQSLTSKLRVQSLGRIKFSNSDELDQEFKFCSICYVNYKKDQELILLPCIHRFHHDCIYQWLLTSSTCPICKIDITSPTSSKFRQNY
ncbi:unnamed protein product [Paramecium sonneborni]|uniref:RING-type domain-containing protein n=1 Tax=Paramecium sonneborni TaxID=65129 RepID=A0A8S1NK79_9CILI|nr:unnamed protein product [Paramecium sonneborni]